MILECRGEYEREAVEEKLEYIVDGTVVSPAGIRARLRTVWIIETGESLPRFVTAYPVGEKTIKE